MRQELQVSLRVPQRCRIAVSGCGHLDHTLGNHGHGCLCTISKTERAQCVFERGSNGRHVLGRERPIPEHITDRHMLTKTRKRMYISDLAIRGINMCESGQPVVDNSAAPTASL